MKARLLLGALLLAQAAVAQTVYRCGPDGRVYSQTPCEGGKALTVDDPRSAGQQKSAREVAARDAEQAKQLADERRQREQAARGQAAAGFRTAPASEPVPAPKVKASKGKTAATDPAMSPPMRVPAQAAAPR